MRLRHLLYGEVLPDTARTHLCWCMELRRRSSLCGDAVCTVNVAVRKPENSAIALIKWLVSCVGVYGTLILSLTMLQLAFRKVVATFACVEQVHICCGLRQQLCQSHRELQNSFELMMCPRAVLLSSTINCGCALSAAVCSRAT